MKNLQLTKMLGITERIAKAIAKKTHRVKIGAQLMFSVS